MEGSRIVEYASLINTMKTLLLSALLFTFSLPVNVNAQEFAGCFALDENNNYVDLSSLCNYPIEAPATSPPVPRRSNDEIFRAMYQDGFCSAQRAGMSLEQSNESGLTAAGHYIDILGDNKQEPLVSAEAMDITFRFMSGELSCL